MANENQGAQGANESTTEQDSKVEMDKFAGFATKDGEVEQPPAPAAKTGMQQQPKPAAKAAKQAQGQEDGDDGQQDDPKHASADKRIGQAVGRQRAAERRADAAEARATATETRLAALEARLTGGGKADTAPKAPDPKDYEGGEYDTKYLSDLVDFRVQQGIAKATQTVRTETQQSAATREQQERITAFSKARDEFAAKAVEAYPDFEEVVFDDDNPVTQTLAELSMDSDHGARIMYELAQDPKEASRVSKLSASRQAAWFGRREAALDGSPDDTGADEGGEGDGQEQSSSQSGPKSKVSKAPPVPEYNARGSGAVPKTSPATTDFAAFERMASGGRQTRR